MNLQKADRIEVTQMKIKVKMLKMMLIEKTKKEKEREEKETNDIGVNTEHKVRDKEMDVKENMVVRTERKREKD